MTHFSIKESHLEKLACPSCTKESDSLTLMEKEGSLFLVCEGSSRAYRMGDVVYFTEKCNPKKCRLECMKACPANAFYFKKILPGVKSKRIHINESCTHCGACADACPLKGLVKVKTPVFNSKSEDPRDCTKYTGDIECFDGEIRAFNEDGLVPSTRLTFEYLAGKISEGFLLDDGCGSQNFKAYLKNKVDAEVFGVDIRADHYAYHPINTLADSQHLPIKKDSVNTVVSNFVLEHTTEPARYLSEVKRVLKPSSRAYVSVPTPTYHLAYLFCFEGWIRYALSIVNNPWKFLRNPVKHFLVERAHERDWSLDSRQKVTFLDEMRRWHPDNWRKLLTESQLDIVDDGITGNILSLNNVFGKTLGNSKRLGVHRTFVVE
ncbi:MAG: methyltransferase domain-containing protein [Methanobacteriota archaeon]